MAKYSNVVEYNIVTDVDSSGIVKLQNELTKLKQSLKFDKIGFGQLGFDDAKIDKSIRKVNQLQSALTAAFNPKIGTLDLSKLNTSLQKEHTSLQMIVKDWEQMGTRGTMAISNLSNALLSMNKSSMNVNTTLSKIANTFSNTVRWGITASIFQEMMSSVQGAVSYMKNLDESLTQIQMVTNSSKENMRELAQYANNAAQALGSTTVDYTNAVKVFVQEGFSESESKQYANLSTKLANVSEQNTATTSDQITAYRNAFQLDYQQTVEAMDKVANVANNTASNVNELMTASQRAASVAQAVGSSQDSFLAAIATIESVTRQSAEEIGNGLKTIYQRFADIKTGKTAEDGVDYGQYAKALQSVGVDVLDAAGQFKGMDQILKELQEIWSGLDDTMKIAVGEKVAGKFQYNRFAALMNNPQYYQKALGATQGAEGMMDQMNEYYMDSIKGRLKTLQAAGEQVMSTLFNQDAVEPIIEDVTHLVNGLNDMVDAAGGLSGVLTGLSAIMLRTFSTQIAGSISNMASSFGTIIANSQNAKQLQTATALFGLDKLEQGMKGSKTGKLLGSVSDNYDQLSVSTQEKIRDLSQQILELEEQKNGVLRAQEKFFKEISENAIEQQNIKEQEIATEKEIAEQKLQSGKYTQEQYEDEILRLDVLEDESLIYTKLSKEAQEFAKVIADGNAADEGMINRLKEMRSEASGLGINITELEKLIQQLGIAEENLKMSDALINDMTAITQFEASINTLVKGLSAITSIAFGITMLGDAIKTLGDDSATVEEKINAIIMDGLMGLTMLIPAIVSLAQAEWNVVTATGAAIASKITNIAIDGLLAIAESLAAAGATGLADALTAVGIAMEATPVGWILTAIAAVVAIIGSCVIAYNSWQDSIHAASKEFEAQQELLSKTKKNYTDLKDEVESLKQSLDSIGETKSSLADLTKGTDEWRGAVRKLNDQILTLLQTYPELAQYVTNEDGVLNISDVGMDQFYQKQLDEVNHLAGVNSIQQINTLQAQNKKYTEDFYNQWGMGKGLSKEEIETAISNGATELKSGADELNAAFAELKNKVETNTFSINNLSDTVGSLNASYTNYSKSKDITSEEINQKKNQIALEYGGRDLDRAAINNQDFLDAVTEATGKKVVGAIDTSWFDNNIKFKTNNGEDFEYSSEQILDLLADSQIAIDETNRKLEENKIIYEAFGARYDETSKKFIDSSGKTVSSLENLNGVTSDEIAAIKAFQDGIYNDIAIKDFYGSLEEFVTELKNGTLSVDGFSEALLATQVQRKEEGIFGDEGRLTSLSQTQGVTANVDGVTENLKLSSEQAKAIMTDMMKKLNESNLSDEEKLQLMDKIDWNMPVQDILANIQHAIDTGNINSAFVDTAGLEDDSERKSKVLEDYDIGESTLDAYTEQLKTTGELAKQHEELANSLEYAKKQFGDESDEAKSARKALAAFNDESEDMAVDLAQTQKGLESLSDNMAKYGDILKKGDKTTLEYAEAMGTVKKALADTLNVSEESISNSLVEDHLQDIEALAAGDEEALNRLRAAAGQDIVVGFYLAPDSDLTEEHMEYLKQKALEVNSLNIEVGAELNDEQFLDTLDEMLWNGELTRDQVNEYLRGIGLEPEFHTVKKKVTLFDTPGFNIPLEVPFIGTIPFHMGAMQVPGYVEVPQIGSKNKGDDGGYTGGGGTLRRTASPTAPSGQTGISPNYVNDAYKPKGGGGNKGKSGGSGKDTKPKDKDKTEWDYLTDITNDLDRAAAVMEKLSKLEDRLYGSSRVSQIKKLQKEYKNYIKLLEQEVNLAKDHAQLLRTNAYDENGNLTINGYAYRAGFNQVNFDAQGNLENGKAIEAALVNRVNAAINDYNAHRNADDASYYEERVSLAQKDHEGFLKALSEYESTLGKIEDGQSQIQDYKEKIQDATDEIVDAIQDGIEDVLEAIDSQRDFNKMYRDWMQGGSGYSHLGNQHRYYAEGLEGLLSPGQNGVSIFDMQLQSLQDRIKDFKGVFDGDSQNADDEKLSEQAAFENLQEATKNIMGSLEKAVDYYDSLLETVQDASDKMDELIDDRLDEFNNLEDYLDTRLDQLKLLFGDKSYEQQAQLYNEKIAVNMEKMVSINTAIEAKQATVKALEGLEESGKELSTEERKELKDARNKVTSLQKEQLDTESQLLQDIANRLGNQVNAELDTAINNLFGGEDVDWLTQQWELSTRFSEQYLDDYNRAFELQKLQVKYQELLNDTQATSAMAQQRISAQMTQQLKYLREKNHLSEYDVEYAEKKLEILQRELALEDARNNKSQMRLQRNAAGNYDFVYAADEDAINDAKMALLNAQQEAYNLSKRIYKEIYDGALKLSQELKQMVFDVATDASLTTEQQAERIKWIMENTGEYLGNASVELGEISVNLYNDIADAEQLIAEENLGNLADTFEIMRAQSKATQESVEQDLSNSRDNAIDAASDTFESIQGLFNTTQEAIDGNFNDIEGNLTAMLGRSFTNADETIKKIAQGSSERSKDIIGVIGNIDKNFELSVGNMLTNTESIDETFKGAFDNIAGDKEDSYLNQYKNKTTEVLKQAGDEYNTFTEQSINYATEQLELLKQATQDWNSDLDMLKQMIKDNADEIKGWKTEIGFAMTASKDFITESGNLQIAFGKIGTMATIAGDMLDNFGEAAYDAGSAVDTMSNDIEDAYYAIRDAAEAAAQAYDDMAWSASNAAREADSARIAAENAQAALNAVGVANNLAASARNIINNTSSWLKGLFKGGSKKVSYDTNYLWDGFTYSQWDTGGYTGTWTDQGIDDKSGKWAILHQKELVLNADDTKNMLSAVEIVRDIMSNINSLPSLGKITTQNNLTDTIEQRVEINATFPGVTEAIQIKQALEQIADNAYQVANKYKY